MMPKSGFFVFFLCTAFPVRASDARCYQMKGEVKFNITAKSHVTDGCVMIDVIFQSTLREHTTYFACLHMECNCLECYQHTEAPNPRYSSSNSDLQNLESAFRGHSGCKNNEVSFKLCEHGFKTYCIIANEEGSNVYYESEVFKLPDNISSDITNDENPSVIIIAPAVIGSVLLLVLLVAAFVIIWIRKVRNYTMNSVHRSSFGPIEDVEMRVETLQHKAVCEYKQGDRKRVLVAFLSDSVTLGTTVKHFLSLLHKFPNLEVVTLADVYSHEQGILGSSLVAGSSDDLIHQELGILGSAHVDAVMLILTETIIDIWTSATDYHCQTKHIDNKQLKTLVALCHDLRRNDEVMTMAVNYDFLNEDSLKLKTFRALNKRIKVFKIISNSAQLGFQLNIDAIHQMLQYLCDSNYRSLLTWKESMDAELLLESIKKEEIMRCQLNTARKRQCPVHGHLSEIDTCNVNKFDLQCCERNEGYLFPRVDVQETQHVQKKDTRVAAGSRVCHGFNSRAVHQVASDVQSIGYSNVTTAFAKVHFDAKASSLHGQFCPSISFQSNIVDVNSEPTEADVVVHRHTHKEFDNEEIIIIPIHSGNGMAILNDISLKDKGLIMLNLNGGDSSLKGIFEDTRRKSVDSKDDQRADNGVDSSYIEPDEAAFYPDIFIPPADLDEVYIETTVNALMEEIVLINKIDG